MLGRYLSCKERFRINYVLGLQRSERFEPTLEFGNMWHVCEEQQAAQSIIIGPNAKIKSWENALQEHCQGLLTRFPTQQDQVEHWYNICKALFPVYVDHWRQHPDELERTPISQEQVFDVLYRLPSGRSVRLRGKFDAVDLVGKGDDAGIYLGENKTKSAIDPVKLRRQMRFDLQTMTYLTALSHDNENRDRIVAQVKGDYPIKGVRYNVVRRSAHKSVESMLKKIDDDRKAGRIGEWFDRMRVEVSQLDLETFREQCLDPLLENLFDDWEWWSWAQGKGIDPFDHSERFDEFKHHSPRHFRFPYGVYAPLTEGGGSDLDEFLETGSDVGLRRVEKMFTELQ